MLCDNWMKEIRDYTRFLALLFDAVLIPLQSIPGDGLSGSGMSWQVRASLGDGDGSFAEVPRERASPAA